jgi:hypothetical protein
MEPDKRKNYPGNQARDSKGNVIDPNYTHGLLAALNMTTASADYLMDQDKQPIGFYIIPLTAGVINVQLLDQTGTESYQYSAVEVDAYLGRPFEGRIKKVIKTGTTVTGIKVIW